MVATVVRVRFSHISQLISLRQATGFGGLLNRMTRCLSRITTKSNISLHLKVFVITSRNELCVRWNEPTQYLCYSCYHGDANEIEVGDLVEYTLVCRNKKVSAENVRKAQGSKITMVSHSAD